MTVGTPELGPDQRARHAQPPRRALRHVQRRPGQGTLGRRAAGRIARRSAKSSAGSPTRSSAPRSSTRSTAAHRTWRRCRCTASRSRSRIRSTRWTCGRRRRRRPLRHRLPGERSHARRAAAAEGRHHLRQGGQHRIQRHPRRSGRDATSRTAILVSDQGYQRSSWAGNPHSAVRHHARGVARIELGVWRLGQREPRDVQHLRGDQHVVPRTGQPQLRGADPAAQGDGLVPRRGDRRRHPQRSLGHSLPQRHRLRQGARRPEGPGQRLLRPARRVHDRAARERARRRRTRRAPPRPGPPARSRACASA